MEKRTFSEWILGYGVEEERTYLVHTAAPRFIAEIFDEDDPAGILAGLSYALSDGRSLAEFEFWDAIPVGDDLVRLLEQADYAIAVADC